MNKSLPLHMLLPCLFFCNFALAGLVKDQTLLVNGKHRSYDIYIPNHQFDKPLPLVVLLHGYMGDADVMTGENGKKAPYKIWLAIAERDGWIILVPEGEFGSDQHRGWNDCRANAKSNPAVDDMAFIEQLLEKVIDEYTIDKHRLYAHGTSNGGNMVYRLAQERPERFRAMASVVAAMPEFNKCKESQQPISILIMNGTVDPLLPYTGGGVGKREKDKALRGTVLSTEQTLKYWLDRDGITSLPQTVNLPDKDKRDGSTVQIRRYSGGKNNTEVVLYEIRGGGHTEPSLTEHYRRLYKLVVGPQNRDIEMVDEVLKFFNSHR